jgi:phosphatidylserine/phosphatidylglycerophosphate/cardiolipin synthase-like enzyme
VCKILRAAESRLVIVTFSIGDDGMVDALVNDAIDRGVDVEVWAGGVARKQGQRLSDLGARVWLPKPGTNLHAKFIVADGLVAVVGSANLAQTSLTRNLEVGVISTKDVSMWAGQWRRDAVRRFRVL